MRKSVNKVLIIFLSFLLVIMGTTSSFAAESAKAFGISEFYPTYIDDMDFAFGGFEKLGYDASTCTAYRADIFQWLQANSNNYGFYITTHGPLDQDAANGVSFFLTEEYSYIYPSDITGNWHLVYIDACNSKRSNSFADAFKITGRSNRAYLGWATQVPIVSANQFNDYFWNTYVTTRSIQAAAVAAAGQVPGSGTTPIRFAGDTSWYGYAN